MNTNDINKEIQQAEILATICLIKGSGNSKISFPLLDRDFNLPLNEIPDLPPIEKGKSIAANLFLIKFPGHGLTINTPDWFIHLIDICSNGNPGYMQLMYKEILENINKIKFDNTGIPEGYTITTTDFAYCYPIKFPIVLDPEIGEKYSNLWDQQKIPIRSSSFYDSDNK